MPLQRELESLDDVPEAIAEHYTQDQTSGKFVLLVDGMVPKTKVDEFRATNTNLMKEVSQLKMEYEKLKESYGVEPEEVLNLKKTVESIKDKKVLDDEGIEALLEKRLAQLKAEQASEIKVREKRIDELSKDREHWAAKFQRTVIDRELKDAALAAGVRPTALPDVVLRGQGMWHLNDDGRIVAKDGQGDLMYGGDSVTLLTPKEWMETSLREAAPHFFELSGGGGANGGGGPGGSNRINIRYKSDLKSAADKAAFIGKYGLDAWTKLPYSASDS